MSCKQQHQQLECLQVYSILYIYCIYMTHYNRTDQTTLAKASRVCRRREVETPFVVALAVLPVNEALRSLCDSCTCNHYAVSSKILVTTGEANIVITYLTSWRCQRMSHVFLKCRNLISAFQEEWITFKFSVHSHSHSLFMNINWTNKRTNEITKFKLKRRIASERPGWIMRTSKIFSTCRL